jgi:hypothetical protein
MRLGGAPVFTPYLVPDFLAAFFISFSLLSASFFTAASLASASAWRWASDFFDCELLFIVVVVVVVVIVIILC